jgi:hypothetical protein
MEIVTEKEEDCDVRRESRGYDLEVCVALETLKGRKKIGGFDVGIEGDALGKYVIINHETNTISFKIQNGPIKEVGVNGCQVDTIIEAEKLIIEGLNENFPCRENSLAITKLEEALMWSNKRRQDREKRGVEGFNKE